MSEGIHVTRLPGTESFGERKAIGDTHEDQVQRHLESLGFHVYRGSVMSERQKQLAPKIDPPFKMRWFPDFTVSRDHPVWVGLVDAKGTGNGRMHYNIEANAVEHYIELEYWGYDTLVVFHGMQAMWVTDVIQHRGPLKIPTKHRTPYYEIPKGYERPVADLIGQRMPRMDSDTSTAPLAGWDFD